MIRSLKEVAGFRNWFLATKSNSPEDNVEIVVTFHHLNYKYRRYLKSFLKRRKAKIVDDSGENNGIINPESKRAIHDGLIASTLTFSATIFSIIGFADFLELNFTAYAGLMYSIGPAIGAFASTILIHYKR